MSDSDDDFYGNTIGMFQAMRERWEPDDVESDTEDTNIFIEKDNSKALPKHGNLSNDSDNGDSTNITPEECLAIPSVEELIKMRTGKSITKKTKQSRLTRSSLKSALLSDVPPKSPSPSPNRAKGRQNRGGRRGKGRGKIVDVPPTELSSSNISNVISVAIARGSGRKRMRGQNSLSHMSETSVTSSTNKRTPNQRGRRKRNVQITINIGCSSDEECNNIPIFSNNINLNDTTDPGDVSECLENSNKEQSVKVCWQSTEYHKFNIRRKINCIFEKFASLVNVPMDHLLLTLGDRVLSPHDTPDSIKYNISQFIEGGVVSYSVSKIAEESAKNHNTTNNKMITIKMQSKNMKQPFNVSIEKNQNIQSYALVQFAEEFSLSISKLKLYFDGDPVGANATPATLDLEGGECLDVIILS